MAKINETITIWHPMTDAPKERNKDYLIHFQDTTMNTKPKERIMIDHFNHWGEWMFFNIDNAFYHKTNTFYQAIEWCELPGVNNG